MPRLLILAPAGRCPTIRSGARTHRIAGGSTRARRWRHAGLPSWREADAREYAASERDIGDAILARKDAPASYHLSCVVDDAASGVNLVVRGADLRASTPIQRLLQALLALPEPDLPPPPARRPRRRPPAGQARPGADARRDARNAASTGFSSPIVCGRQAPSWFQLHRRLIGRHALATHHPAHSRDGGDRLCPRPRRDRDGFRARTSPASSSRIGCASAFCSRQWRSSSSS